MSVVKAIFKLLVILGASSYFSLSARASNEMLVSKERMPYEILSISMNQNTIEIKGWVLISYTQHYQNDSDHRTELEFFSINDSFRIRASLSSLSMTKQMEYFGSPKCGVNSTNQIPEVCNYSYDNVGFTAIIPIESFKVNEVYQTNIISHAFKSNLVYKTPVYFPMQNDLNFVYQDKNYNVKSKLDDTEIRVTATTVIARTTGAKTSPYWYNGTNCSTTYKNQLFFLKNSVYKEIFDRNLFENTSYYRVKADLSACDGQRRRIVEGKSLSPVWIASTYVQYSGTPLQISSKYLNRAPYFESNEVYIYKGQKLNINDYVKAFDYEEGDISHRIQIVSSNYVDEVGKYSIDLVVYDKENLKANTTLIVNVLAIPNNKPIIYANDLRILQFSKFNYLDHFSAFDTEDGNLTNKLINLSNIDTSVISTQELCLFVEDSKLLNDTKCINIEIYSNNEKYEKYRSISKNNTFYNESVPSNWENIIYILNNLLYLE